jgi:glycosyltransferase involved in cell wall biosynthesis
MHLVVHPKFDHYAPEVVALASQHPSRVAIHPLTETEFAATETDTILRRAIAGWEAIEERGRRFDIDHCVVMEMNAYQPVLGLPRAREGSFQTSGILFFPYCRIPSDGLALSDRVWASVERFRKYCQMRWVISNPNVETIFVLNDEWGADQMNDDVGRDVFHPLPDPVPPSPDTPAPEDEIEWSNTWWTEAHMHFLLFGSLRRHKGVEQTIEAFGRLPEQAASQMALHLLGQPREELEGELSRLTDALKDRQPDLTVHLESRFLSDTELDLALQQSHVVLAPYQRTEGSSGVIGHAAKHGCPVIGPQTGLIGSLIRDYDLGLTIDTTSPNALCRALRRCLGGTEDVGSKVGMKRYVDERSPETFAETILSTLEGSSAHPE